MTLRKYWTVTLLGLALMVGSMYTNWGNIVSAKHPQPFTVSEGVTFLGIFIAFVLPYILSRRRRSP